MPWRTIGQEPARRFLARSVEVGRVVHAYLFTGPPGVGKTTLALDFARALLCVGDARPCDACPECRLLLGAGHPDVEQVEADDEGLEFSALWKPGAGERPRRALRIERVRELIRVMATRPNRAAYRVATLDGGAVQDAAASALLKLFEEPSPRAMLILRATSAEALPLPISSRCQVVRLSAVPTEVIAEWLAADGVARADAVAYATLAGGRPGLAKRLSQSGEARGALDAQAALWTSMPGADTVTRLDQAAVWGRNYAVARAALDLAALVWQALLRQAAGGEGETTGSAPAFAALQHAPARAISASGVANIGAQLAAIARASRLLDANTQPRLTMEWLLLALGGVESAC